MKNCANCKHGKWFDGAVKVCEVHNVIHNNEYSCGAWEHEDLRQRTLEEIEREGHHDF